MVDPPLAMKCIVINLPRAAARRRAMRSQFEALGIEFEIFNATDWRDLNEEDWTHVDRESRDMEGRRPLSRRHDRLPHEPQKGARKRRGG